MITGTLQWFTILQTCTLLLLCQFVHATNSSSSGSGYIQDLFLYNTRSNPGTKLFSLESGTTVIDLASTGTDLTIVANMNSTVIGYIVYEFDNNYTNKENFPFYALNGNSGSYLIPFEPITKVGMHTVNAKFYHIKTNALLDSVSVAFDVIDTNPVNGPLTGFTLIDTNTGDGRILPRIVDLAVFGTSLSILADTKDSHSVEDILFYFDNKFIRTEYTGPWALNGNQGDTIYPFYPLTEPGIHTVVAVAKGYRQETLGNITYTFIVKDSRNAPIQKPISAPTQSPLSVPIALPIPSGTVSPTSSPISLVPTGVSPTVLPTDIHTTLRPIRRPTRAPTTKMTPSPSNIEQTVEPTDFMLQPSTLPFTGSPAFSSLIPTSPTTKFPFALPSESPVPSITSSPSFSLPAALPSISPVPSLTSETNEPTSTTTIEPPSNGPTIDKPSGSPSVSSVPVKSASPQPTLPTETEKPYTIQPTIISSVVPTMTSDVELPTLPPSSVPLTTEPTQISSIIPTITMETIEPVGTPSFVPSEKPVVVSSIVPTQSSETDKPTVQPTSSPTKAPTLQPTLVPSLLPTSDPSSETPTSTPLLITSQPSFIPSILPTNELTALPSNAPIIEPTGVPTVSPFMIFTPTMVPFYLTEEPTPPIDPTGVPATNTPTSVPVVSTKQPIAPVMVPAPIVTPTVSDSIKGELRKWHKLTLELTGPMTSETDTTINPFMDYRLDVTFTHEETQKQYVVPGFYAADGNAAETSAVSGNQWQCHFSPDEVGLWKYETSFVTGKDVAVNGGGTPTFFDGDEGFFFIEESNKTGRDLRSKGRLKYVGAHHLQFAEGEWFLKVGADSPENFLAYDGFDNTPDYNGYRKSWSPHVDDYRVGDPTWQGGKGTGIIGAINYLSNEGMNAFSFLTLNIEGDDENVFPFISDAPEDRLRMDVSKLAQWEIVFEHADTMGMYLHFKMGEQENGNLLDGGSIGNERKLYYRELIARFGHHLALNWNLSEEIENTVDQIQLFADYVKEVDPYNSIVLFHTSPNSDIFSNFLGFSSIDGASIQSNPASVFETTLNWVSQSAATGKKWIVANDEQNPALVGVLPDSVDPEHNDIRIDSLWGNLMAGGAGVEYYFGYAYDNSDLTCEDFRSRANMWKQSRHALSFFVDNNVPFWTMTNQNFRLPSESEDRVLMSDDGKTIVVYRNVSDGIGIIMMDLPYRYSVEWYNPRDGGVLQEGSVTTIVGGGETPVSYGSPPESPDLDWVILLKSL